MNAAALRVFDIHRRISKHKICIDKMTRHTVRVRAGSTTLGRALDIVGDRKDECHVSKLQLLPSESRRAGRGPANAPSYDSQQDTHHPHAIAAARRPIPPYAKAMTSKYD